MFLVLCLMFVVLVDLWVCVFLLCVFFFSSRRRHTRCALVTGVQTCALPISRPAGRGFGPFSFFLRLVRLRRRVQEVLNHLLELWVLGWVVFVTLDHQCSTLPRTSRLIREIAAASSRRYTGTVVSRFAARRRRSCETELSFSRSATTETSMCSRSAAICKKTASFTR